MAELKFGDLKQTYESFREPKATVYIDNQEMNDQQLLTVNHVEVELTAGYEASIATLTLGGVYDETTRSFEINKTKQFLYLGSMVVIYLGYGTALREVFRGFIAKVHFILPPGDLDEMPSAELTCMDVKGLMMANRHSKKLKALYFSDAVKEILESYPIFQETGPGGKLFMEMNIGSTPDKPPGANGAGQQKTTDRRVEMVEESDYEFIVKAAKRYNFDFFVVGKSLYFIEAKKNKTPLIALKPGSGVVSLDVGYDMTGLVNEVVVRNIDMLQGKYIGDKKQSKNKISLGNKAKPLIDKQSLVYIDPTTDSKEEAGYRASYLLEQVGYRLGSITGEIVGMPEIVPGRFITLEDFGTPVNNNFYLTNVRHTFTGTGYKTTFEGCANVIGS
ncbi:MAG: phage late control D family protein [Eubacterium sp.]|nr:phage late control D family protein [Eubacterium sp.]